MLEKFINKKRRTFFEGLIKAHHGALYKHALWMTGKQDVAGDMVQETYFQAWQGIVKLKDRTKALPWLLAILRRAIYREQRYQYRQVETVEQLSLIEESIACNNEYRLLDIYSALESISTKHKDVFLLHHLHGFSYDEISEQLDIPKGTVMSRLSRSREALQKILKTSNEENIFHIGEKLRGQKNDR